MKRSRVKSNKVVGTIPFVKGFKLATRMEQIKGVLDRGQTEEDIPIELQALEGLFHPIPQPTHELDWLAQFKEERQSYKEWLTLFNDLSATRDRANPIVYLRAVGKFEECASFSVERLKEYTEVYYPGLTVKTLPPLDFAKTKDGQLCTQYNKKARNGTLIPKELILRTRVAHEYDLHKVPKNHRQICTNEILRTLFDTKPNDAYCIIGVTMEDLYQTSKDSFIGGLACGGSGEAIFSFARYDPAFLRKKKATVAERQLLLKRSGKVVVHELAHLFNIGHCTYYDCCMNGSGHLPEDYAQSSHLCPIDLKKLQTILSCDLVERYRGLEKYYRDKKFDEDADWVAMALKKINEYKRVGKNNDTEPQPKRAKLTKELCI